MKKFNVPEELGTKFTNPQILSVSNGYEICDISKDERTYADGSSCCACDPECGCHEDCHTPWWRRALCGSQCECDDKCHCDNYRCDCDDKCRCDDYEQCQHCRCVSY